MERDGGGDGDKEGGSDVEDGGKEDDDKERDEQDKGDDDEDHQLMLMMKVEMVVKVTITKMLSEDGE